MQQIDFDDIPIARNSDTSTSKDAEAKQNLGPRAKRAREILTLVFNNPHCTSGELARIYFRQNPTMPIQVAAETPHKRISDLMQKDLVRRDGKRKCADSGYDAHTYVVTGRGYNELFNND